MRLTSVLFTVGADWVCIPVASGQPSDGMQSLNEPTLPDNLKGAINNLDGNMSSYVTSWRLLMIYWLRDNRTCEDSVCPHL